MSLAVATATTTPRYTAPAWPGRRPPAGPRAHAPGRRLSAPRSHDLAAIREWAQTGTPDTPRADNPNHGNTGRNQVQELQRLDRPFHMSIIGDVLGRRIKFEELSPDEFRSETEGSWPRPVVDMLLAAWGATIGRPAFVTSTVSGILRSAPRSFRQWATDHATAFTGGPAPSS